MTATAANAASISVANAYNPGTNVVSVYIGYLRRRLTVAGEKPPIETVRSVGYRLTSP